MDIKNLSFELSNIVLLFDNLHNAKISRDQLFSVIENSAVQPIEIGPLIIVRYPEQKTEITVIRDDRRVEIKKIHPSETDWALIPEISTKVYAAFSECNLTSYGFNYFAHIPLESSTNSDAFLVNQFKPSLGEIEKQTGSNITSISTVFKYEGKNGINQISLESIEPNNSLRVTLNIHFKSSSLKELANLQECYAEEKENFIKLLTNLFE